MARGAIHDATGPVGSRPFVVCVPHMAGMHIEPDSPKATMGRLFWMALSGSPVANRYRGGNVFAGDFWACIIHVEWWLESLTVQFDVGFSGHTIYAMFDAVRGYSKKAG